MDRKRRWIRIFAGFVTIGTGIRFLGILSPDRYASFIDRAGSTPALLPIVKVVFVVLTILNIFYFVEGVGIFFFKEWARRLFIYTLVISSVFIVVALYSVTNALGTPFFSVLMNYKFVFGFAALFIGVLLYTFTRPSVKELF